MPNGRTHAAATVLASGASAPVMYWLLNQPLIPSLVFAGGCMLGLLLSPDLDVRSGSHSFAVMRKTFGGVVAWAWRWFWQPYARLIPRHRHPLSHLPIVSTALRVLYLLLIGGGLWEGLRFFAIQFGAPAWLLPTTYGLLNDPLFWWAFWGLALSDGLHTLMDWVW